MLRFLPFIVALLLLLALLHWHIWYYTTLRWVVMVIAVGCAVHEYYGSKRMGWMITLSVMAIVFNPIAPLYLSKGVWRPIDIVVALVFAVYGVVVMRREN